MDSFSPVERKEVKQKSLKALENLGHKDLQLDEYESTSAYPFLLSLPNICSGQIASEIIHPDDIEVRFSGTPTTSFLPPTQPLTSTCAYAFKTSAALTLSSPPSASPSSTPSCTPTSSRHPPSSVHRKASYSSALLAAVRRCSQKRWRRSLGPRSSTSPRRSSRTSGTASRTSSSRASSLLHAKHSQALSSSTKSTRSCGRGRREIMR